MLSYNEIYSLMCVSVRVYSLSTRVSVCEEHKRRWACTTGLLQRVASWSTVALKHYEMQVRIIGVYYVVYTRVQCMIAGLYYYRGRLKPLNALMLVRCKYKKPSCR